MRNIAKQRREKAIQEIGHTIIKQKVGWVLVFLFCMTIVSVPIIQHIAEIRKNLTYLCPADR